MQNLPSIVIVQSLEQHYRCNNGTAGHALGFTYKCRLPLARPVFLLLLFLFLLHCTSEQSLALHRASRCCWRLLLQMSQASSTTTKSVGGQERVGAEENHMYVLGLAWAEE